jgi:hypothetical protein
MKQILQLLSNPVIIGVGVALVLYFALFANKKNPESLGNRLSAEKVKKNFNEVQEKGRFIATNVKMAKTMAKEKAMQSETKSQVDYSRKSEEGDKISCGDEVEISYGIYAKDGQQLEFFNLQKLLIGSKKNWLIEKNIIGMKRGEINSINIPQNFQSEDKKLAELLKLHTMDLKYQLTILSLTKTDNQKISCN